MPLSDRPFGPTSGAASVANMTPLNQQAAQSGPLPALQVLTTTAETVILSPEDLLNALIAQIPPDKFIEQKVLDLWATGYIKTTSTSNLTLKVYSGTSTTVGSNTLLGSSGTVAQNTVTISFWAHARLIYDSVDGTLQGDIEFYLNKTRIAQVTLSNFPTAVINTNNPVASFVLTLTSSGATTGTPTTINVQTYSVG